MAVSKNTKSKKQASDSAYKSSGEVSSALSQLSAISDYQPRYVDSYSDRLKSLYERIREAKPFAYSPENDAAYRRFAEEYNALGSLAAVGNNEAAQGLTGGFGSDYAPEVAAQGEARMSEEARNAQSDFALLARGAHEANDEALSNRYNALSEARRSELSDFENAANAFNEQLAAAQKNYSETRDNDYRAYSDNRDFWAQQFENELAGENAEKKLELKKYDVYEEIAENKCAQFAEKKNNSAMRSYLDNMVKQGKLTKYLADNLYQRYKYTAPASRSSGGSRSSRSSGRSSGKSKSSELKEKKFDAFENWLPNANIIKFINLNNRAGDFNTAVHRIDELVKQGRISKEDKLYYVYYYRNMLG